MQYIYSPPHSLSLSLAQRFSPLSSACCSALTCLFSSIISHTSQADLITLACVDTYGFHLPAEVTETGPYGSRPDGSGCSLICSYTGFTGV